MLNIATNLAQHSSDVGVHKTWSAEIAFSQNSRLTTTTLRILRHYLSSSIFHINAAVTIFEPHVPGLVFHFELSKPVLKSFLQTNMDSLKFDFIIVGSGTAGNSYDYAIFEVQLNVD